MLQDITKQQVTNLSLPGDTEGITAANLCWTVPVFRRKDNLFITQRVRTIPFPPSQLWASQNSARAESYESQLYAMQSQGSILHSQALSESLYQLRATVFIITYIIVEAGLVIVLRSASQEREKGWNKWPGRQATVGQAAVLIWKDGCNYESPEEVAVWRVQCVNMVLTVRKVPCPLFHSKVRHWAKSIFSISQDQFSIWAQRKPRWLWPICINEKSNFVVVMGSYVPLSSAIMNTGSLKVRIEYNFLF